MPVYIIAEIGINHNGNIELALKMMEEAKKAGADAVKFQKRVPELCIPAEMVDKSKDTPWGTMSYLEYKERVEFGHEDYYKIDLKAKELRIDWSASVWDIQSFMFLNSFLPPWIKIPSAMNQNMPLMNMVRNAYPMIVSTGGLLEGEVVELHDRYGRADFLHCVSAYPATNDVLNLKVIPKLKKLMPDIRIGYSGHEVGLATTIAAVALGAEIVERHFTLDRSMWGSDQAASVEPQGFSRMVKDIRAVEEALGNENKWIQPGEREKLVSLGWKKQR